jgi:hypothetical protein
MGQRILSIISVACLFSTASAMGASFEIPLPALFQYSPTQLGRSITSKRSVTSFAPRLTFKSEITLNEEGQASMGERCVVSSENVSTPSVGFFNSGMNVVSGGKILAQSSYEMRLVSYQQEVLKISLKGSMEKLRSLELTCTDPNIQSWTVSEFETALHNKARVYASAELAAFAVSAGSVSARAVAGDTSLMGSINGSQINGLFGSGLPGTTGVQLLLGADLKAYAEATNATLERGKSCKLISQGNAALNDQYLKGSKFAFREMRVIKAGKVEFVFDNWNHSPHQVRVECRGDIAHVQQMTLAEVEHDLNGTIQFYRK